MARSVRVVDSPEYSDVVGADGRLPYRRRWAGRESLVFILILALLLIWMYRNRSLEVFGKQIGVGEPILGTSPPVEINATPIIPPVMPAEPRPVITVEPRSDVMGYSRVVAESLNLRAGPGHQYIVITVLPRYWEVAILRQLHITPDGEAWVEVMATTNQGWRKGWVLQRYIENCNCPTY